MSLFKLFKMDEGLEKSGVPIQVGEPNVDGTYPTFYLARMGGANKKFEKALDNAIKPYKRQIDMNLLADEKAEEIMQKTFVDTVLVGWKNVFDENEQKLDFNRENALSLFDQLPELYRELRDQAAKASNFRLAQLENDSKN